MRCGKIACASRLQRRAGFAQEDRCLFRDVLLFLLGKVAYVNYVGRLERPTERLYPWHREKKTCPPHYLDGFRIGVLACDGDPTRQTPHENDHDYNRYSHNGERREGQVVPQI